jgi:hypothetical protein
MPLVGFRVPPEFRSASPSRAPTQGERPSSSHELSFPSALSGTEDPHTRVCLTRFGPPSGFGCPLDGFRPSEPGRPCFMPTALLGFLTPFGAFSSRKVPEAITPPGGPACRQPVVTPSGEPSSRTDRPRLPGLDPFGSPSLRPALLTPSDAGCSLGLYPFQGFLPASLNRVSPGLLPRAWPTAIALIAAAPAPRSVDQRPTRPASSASRSWRLSQGNPHKVFAPCGSQAFRPSTVRAMCSPRRVLPIAGRSPFSLDR